MVISINRAKNISDVVLDEETISIEEFVAVARYDAKVTLSEEYCSKVNKSKDLLEKSLRENQSIYGLTSGVGDNLTNVILPRTTETLQQNIVRSHAVSVGTPLEREIVRAMQLMILVNLGKGYSGVRLEVLQLLVECLNKEIIPFVPGEGSVGYLSPEAHMILVLMGEGQVYRDDDQLISGKEALEKNGLLPVTLRNKEGLALISGTTSVTGIAVLALYNGIQAAKTADVIGAMSFEALKGTVKAFDPRYHSVKKHDEQVKTAENIMRILKGSEISYNFEDYRLQDALSLRTIPQVHGAVKKSLKDAFNTIINEMNSCSDNPIIYPENDGGIGLMGGNPDGTFVGIQADTISIAMANLAKMSERRGDRLVNHHLSELPSFLIKDPGINNGYMIPQYTSAGLLREIKILAQPATIDSISMSAGQEDTVSFAYLASKKAYDISRKTEYILSIELMESVQALEFFNSFSPSLVSRKVCDLIRSKVPTVKEDRFFYPDIQNVWHEVHHGSVLETVENAIGELAF